ncbi:MAG: penicillin-binding protein 2 [bacterium]|nr:penicillin-binding protein 2 [bacterium]
MIILSVILLLILAVRLFQIQVLASGGYLRLSLDNQFREIRIPAPRGMILDRQGHPLAANKAACEVSVSVRALDRDRDVITALAEILDCREDMIRERLERARQEHRPRAVIERDLLREQILILEERLMELPGVHLQDWPLRTYPNERLAAHLLGYVGEVSDSEVDTDSFDPRAYRLGDNIGRMGVEKTYEPLLRGTDGKELILVNARGAQLSTVEFLPPVAGNRLYLTLDLNLTAELDSALAFWGAGAGVVLNVETGEILAAASRPAFDPNQLVGGIPTAVWERLTNNPDKPLFNRVSMATYSPGSIFKPLVSLKSLSEGIVTPETRLRTCLGGLRLGRRTFRCWEPNGHGRVGLIGALEQSCDVYYYQVGEMLGVDNIAEQARAFGLGSASGADLDSEARGLIPDTRWYDNRYGEGKWTTGHVWNVAIGQGEVLVSCLQMARVYAALANGGYLVTPRLRHHVEDENGDTYIPFSPNRGRRRIDLDPDELAVVKLGMEAVLYGENGTARGSKLRDFRMAGKTGTVQNPHGLEHAWFSGYAPAENPEIAIAIIVEHGQHGSDVAPIFRQLVNSYFNLGKRPIRRGPREPEAPTEEGE